MPNDRYTISQNSLLSPSFDFVEVTPNDTVELDTIPKAIFVSVGGDLVVQGVTSDAPVTFTVAGGTLLPIRPKLVLADGTTATGIIALL